jgi:hypothetical protein
MGQADWIHFVTRVVEIVGSAIITVGSFGALSLFLFRMATNVTMRAMPVATFRPNLGRAGWRPVLKLMPVGLGAADIPK